MLTFLGSTLAFTNEQGQVVAQRLFDPFGKPRNIDGRVLSVPRFTDIAQSTTARGFTDHEHLNEAELIHMNGRVYDYNLGRFLSVDPLIQAPGNSQSINPYSYIMNNPLSGTDPTGYASEEIEKKVKVSTTGSRIKRTVTVKGTSNSSGGATVTISGGNGAARSAVKGALTSKLTGAGFNVADIGSEGSKANGGNAPSTNVDPLASGSGTEFNGTETVSTTPTSNAASIDTVKKKKWRKAFGEDGKQITDIRKSGKPKWSDVAGSGNLLDKLLKKSLNLDIEILEQNTTVWDKWEQVEVSETYKTTSNSLSNYQDKLIKVTRPQLTGRTRWVDTGRVVNVELMDFRACPLSCSNSGGGVINGFTGGALGGGN
jgi:RHS repeat-associated protein